MSPRLTRAAMAERSAVSTRSRAQKIINVSQSAAKSAQKVGQSQKKSTSVRNNLETSATRNVKEELSDMEVTFKKSKKKKTTRRRLVLDERLDTSRAQEDKDMNLSDSIKILRDRHCSNIATVELVKTDILQLKNGAKNLDLEKMPSGKLQRKISATNVTSPIMITPKSTPPKLNLTPHRSKKTPKKSPISLGSPKTHSIAIPKLFKSPRKLSLVATGENSEKNLEKSNSSKKLRRNKDSLDSPSSDINTSPIAKHKHNKSGMNLMVRKFSKSPKIVLKSPKSKKSKPRKLKLSPSRMKKSTSKTRSTSPGTPMSNLKNDKSSKISPKRSPSSKRMNLSSIKYHLLNPKLTKILTASQINDVLAEPIVLLEKLPLANLKQKYMPITSKTQSDTSIKVKSPSSRARSNSKILIPIKKASAGSSTKRNSNTKLRNSSMEESQINNTNGISSKIKYNVSIQEEDRSPLMSSTPQEKKMILTDTSLASNTSIDSVNNTSFNSRLRHRNQSNIQLSSTMDKNTDIENVSEPFLSDKEISDTSQSCLSNVMKQDATYDKDNSIEKKQENDTYELEQPQTLNLRQMIKKRTSTDINLSLKDNIKKTKVRFADVSSDANNVRKSINKLNGSQSSISHNVSAQRRNNVINSAHKSKKAGTSKFTQNSLTSSFKRLSPRIHGGTLTAQLNRIQVTPKTFASVEKKSEKKSSTKKAPNFGRIHEQMFAKSESLVDAKKRLQARHLAFSASKVISKDEKTEEKKPLPSDTRDGIHNRFGFKLKKPEATHIMLKKQTVFSREKQQHETRLMLKGVRTNRRFELQMRARNLDS